MRKFAAAVIGGFGWLFLFAGGAIALIGLYAAVATGGYVIDAGNAGPGLLMAVFGGAVAAGGWGLRRWARQVRPGGAMAGLVRG